MGKKTAFEWDDDDLDRLADKIAERIKAYPRWQPYRPYWTDPRYAPHYQGPYWWQSPVTSTRREG